MDDDLHDPFGPWAHTCEHEGEKGSVEVLTSKHLPSGGTAMVIVAWPKTYGAQPGLRFELLRPKEVP